MRPVLACLLTIFVLAGVSGAKERDLVGELLAATDPKARLALREEILAADPDPGLVAARLAQGRAYSGEVGRGWLARTNLCSDGVERPYLLFVPEDYDPAQRYRLVVDLHGGISRPACLTHQELEQMKFFWGEHAADHGYLLALPTGQAKAVWWDEVGSRNVLTMIDRLKREYNVDENLVFATGFSDGGTGSYYLALTWPTPFAGFIPLNGHPAVAGAGGLQIHLRNFWNKPMYAVNTENDSLYPSVAVKPIMDALKEIGAKVVWRDIAGYTHNPMYLPEERPAIWKWAQATRRDPHPARVFWEGAFGAPHRVHWLSVTGVRETAGGTPFPDLNPLLPNQRMIIGVNLDQEFAGPGLKISGIVAGSPAESAGIQAGDVITAFDGAPTADFEALRAAISARQPEDGFTVTVRRGDEELTLSGRFPKLVSTPAFARTKPFGSIEATADGNRFDVRCDHVGAFDLYLSPAMVAFPKPVQVIVNGKTVHDAVVEPDLAFLTTMALEDDDRTMLYLARLSIEVPAAEEETGE
jgi:hypothetical protein